MFVQPGRSRGHPAAPALVLALLLCAGVPCEVEAQGAAPGTVLGVVRDSMGMAIAGAHIGVRGTQLGALTDDEGSFRLTTVPSGVVVLDVRRLGFVPSTALYDLKSGGTIQVELLLAPVPHLLDAVLVRGAGDRSDGAFGGFYQRRALGIGRFVTREEIERRNVHATTDLFRMVPGVNVVMGRGERKMLRLRGSRCSPLIWMDGTPLWQGYELDFDAISPRSIEGIEIYSMASLPPQFRSGNSAIDCGVIVVWTRRGEPRPRRRAKGSAAEELAEQVRALTIHTADAVDEPARRLEQFPVLAEYPAALHAQRVSGSVMVEFVVDTLGAVDESTFNVISASHEAFAGSVRAALGDVRFSPARLDGRLVRQVVQLPFYFLIAEADERGKSRQ